MTGLSRIEARWEKALPVAPESWNAQTDVRLLVAVAKAGEEVYHCDDNGADTGHFYEPGELRSACSFCVALAGLDGAP